MINEVKEEKPVEVTLPEETVAEVELSDSKSKVSEESPIIKVKDDSTPAPTAVLDEREKALQDLKKQYEHQKRVAEAEREARKQAELFARQQAQQVGYARNEVQDSNLKIILNAIDATEQAAATAEREYVDAMNSGDHNRAIKAQRVIAQAESQLLQLQNGRQKLEESLQEPVEGSVYEQQVPNFEPQIPQDPVEMFAERLAPRSAAWLRSHPDAVNKLNKLSRAHEDAVEDGITPESDEYFQYIESRLGYAGEQQAVAPREVAAAPREASRRSIASAPVTSAASVMSPRANASPNTMVLSSDEVEMAILAEPGMAREKAIESYARNKAYLIKQGKLSA
jgi:hypothetical protein